MTALSRWMQGIWLQACFGTSFSWRGNDMSLDCNDVGLGTAVGRS
jgi:hypothetical protein